MKTGFVIFAILSLLSHEIQSADPLPNIVLIVADDLGYADVLFHPNPATGVSTPHLADLTRLHDNWLGGMAEPVNGGTKRFGFGGSETVEPKQKKQKKQKKNKGKKAKKNPATSKA